MPLNSRSRSYKNAEKSLALVSALFPGKEWVAHGENIFVAKNRLSGGHKEQAKLYREIADARILTNGITAEHSVFLRLFTPFTVESVRAKLAGELKNTTDKGSCICYFEATGKLHAWDYDELRAIIGT